MINDQSIEESRDELLAALKKLFDQAAWITEDNAKQYYEVIERAEKLKKKETIGENKL